MTRAGAAPPALTEGSDCRVPLAAVGAFFLSYNLSYNSLLLPSRTFTCRPEPETKEQVRAPVGTCLASKTRIMSPPL